MLSFTKRFGLFWVGFCVGVWFGFSLKRKETNRFWLLRKKRSTNTAPSFLEKFFSYYCRKSCFFAFYLRTRARGREITCSIDLTFKYLKCPVLLSVSVLLEPFAVPCVTIAKQDVLSSGAAYGSPVQTPFTSGQVGSALRTLSCSRGSFFTRSLWVRGMVTIGIQTK